MRIGRCGRGVVNPCEIQLLRLGRALVGFGRSGVCSLQYVESRRGGGALEESHGVD